MTRTILDIHILQSVPPSNLNRDDTGAPKSAVYGGVRRARVSSQAWKRATRLAFERLLPPEELGVRTKKVAEALAERITARNENLRAVSVELAAETMKVVFGREIKAPKRKVKEGADAPAPESPYLVFLSRRQLDALAELTDNAVKGCPDDAVTTLEKHFGDKEQGKANKAAARQAIDTRHSVDIALFGRMVADAADLGVDAATQVAHALSVHACDIESDYYTAVDDRNEDDESGAGMIGTVDFNSATLYRYAAVDVDALHRTLGIGLQNEESPSMPAQRAVGAFLEAFITSLPTGKINTFGNHTLPSAVIVKVRERWPVSFVGAFEEPVAKSEQGGYLRNSCASLADHAEQLERQYGLMDDPRWVFRVGAETAALQDLGTEVSLEGLINEVRAEVARRLGSGA